MPVHITNIILLPSSAELQELHREIEVVTELAKKEIYDNAQSTIGQNESYER